MLRHFSQSLNEYYQERKSLFDTICYLAIKNDEEKLKNIKQSKISIDFLDDRNRTPIEILAEQGHHNAVELLMTLKEIKKERAITGYARAGRVDRVNKLIQYISECDKEHVDKLQLAAIEGYAESGYDNEVSILLQDRRGLQQKKFIAVLSYAKAGNILQVQRFLQTERDDIQILINAAARGYAKGGYDSQVEILLQQGAKPNDVVMDYACVGNIVQVNRMLDQGASKLVAAKGFAFGGHISEVNQLVSKGVSSFQVFLMKKIMQDWALDEMEQIAISYIFSTHLDGCENDLLKLMAHTTNVELRKTLAKIAKEYRMFYLNIDYVINKSSKLNKMMEDYQLTFTLVNALMRFTERDLFWFLQGYQLVDRKLLISDMYFYIASLLVGLTYDDTIKIHQGLNNKREKEKQPQLIRFASNIFNFFSSKVNDEPIPQQRRRFER